MRLILQRVTQADVKIENETYSSIQRGLLILAGIEEQDTEEDVLWLSTKVCNMRIFSDKDGKMNLSVKDINGEILVVSQFTLHASTKKGNRPSFIKAARPENAIPLYEKLKKEISKELGKQVKSGEFGANMQVFLLNDGPVTIYIDSKFRE
jgi:D-aminoacyl-tRNA deacylase